MLPWEMLYKCLPVLLFTEHLLCVCTILALGYMNKTSFAKPCPGRASIPQGTQTVSSK